MSDLNEKELLKYLNPRNDHLYSYNQKKEAYTQLRKIVEWYFGGRLIVLGDAKYGVAHGAVEGNPTNELIIHKLDKPMKPVGKPLEGYVGKTTDEIDTVCRLFFKNPESVQVFIDELFVIKNKLIEWKQTIETKAWIR